MNTKILCVDDDANILSGFRRSLRGKFTIDTATSGQAGLRKIEEEGEYAVVVADMNMPQMNGVQFLTEVKKRTPNTVRIMLTGNADQQTAMAAVNHGSVFQFLTKPCPPDMLAKTLEVGLKQYRLIVAERELLENTLKGSVKALADVIAMSNPETLAEAQNIWKHCQSIATRLGIEELWELEIAATLARIGLVTIPPATLEKKRSGKPLTGAEIDMFKRVPEVGAELLSKIPRLENVAAYVRYQEKCYDGRGLPLDDVRGKEIPVGARILKAATDLCHLAGENGSTLTALAEMETTEGVYDPDVLAALKIVLRGASETAAAGVTEDARVRLQDVKPGDVLKDPVRTSEGMVLVPAGTVITPMVKEKLLNFAQIMDVSEFVAVERSESAAAESAVPA